MSVLAAPKRVARRALRNARRRFNPVPPKAGQADQSRAFRKARNFGLARTCPICESRLAKFLDSPPPYVRPEAMCPVCGAMEWYRLGWWALANKHPEAIAAGSRVLHVAAEPEIARRFREIPGVTYAALDLNPQRATVMGDLLQLPFPDGAFSLVYCSHVLEHVYDDKAALRELRRVVAPNGAAQLQVPITAEETYGDPTVTDPEERERLFGQHDHVRRYGPDFIDIVRSCGWEVDRLNAFDLPLDDAKTYGLPRTPESEAAADVFWCRPV